MIHSLVENEQQYSYVLLGENIAYYNLPYKCDMPCRALKRLHPEMMKLFSPLFIYLFFLEIHVRYMFTSYNLLKLLLQNQAEFCVHLTLSLLNLITQQNLNIPQIHRVSTYLC